MGWRIRLQIGDKAMEITWKYIKPLKDPSAVKNYLKAHKVDLPQRLIKSIEQFNGGRPSEKQIITSSKREYVFKSMLSYNQTDRETIYSVFPDLFKGTHLFPFASDAAGNFICYDMKMKQCVLLNHESNQAETIIKMVKLY